MPQQTNAATQLSALLYFIILYSVWNEKNSNLLGRSTFAANLNNLILEKGGSITTQDLVDIGNAEDYLRVSSNISSVLEYVLAIQHDYDISQVFTFASTKMPYLAVLLSTEKPVHLYLSADEEPPFSAAQLQRLKELRCDLTVSRGAPVADPSVVVVSSQPVTELTFSIVDAVIQPNVLFINNLDSISSAKVLTHRKRMATPITTPAGLRQLQLLAGIRYPQVFPPSFNPPHTSHNKTYFLPLLCPRRTLCAPVRKELTTSTHIFKRCAGLIATLRATPWPSQQVCPPSPPPTCRSSRRGAWTCSWPPPLTAAAVS